MFGTKTKQQQAAATETVQRERPTLDGCAPKYAAMRDKWGELNARQEQIRRELHDGQSGEMFSQTEGRDANGDRVIERRRVGEPSLAARVRVKASRGPMRLPGAPKPDAPTDFPAAVREKLGDVVEFPKPPSPVVDVDEARAAELTAEWEAIHAAKAALLPQMQRALIDGSKVFCQALLLDYREVVESLVDKMIAFGDAWLAHQKWVRNVQLEGADISSLRIVFAVMDETLLPLIEALEWGIECGLSDPKKMPPDWQKWKRGTLDTAPLHMGKISR